MSSNVLKRLMVCMVGSLVLLGCTEKLPLDPIYTDDTDWTPMITLNYNNYHRIEYTIDRPPRKELLRNILYYRIQARSSGGSNFFTIDSVVGILPSYIYPQSSFYRTSLPLLSYNTNYTLRAAVTYRAGVVRISNEIQFRTPVERGKALKQVLVPKKVPFDNYWFENVLAFHKGKLLVLRDEQLFQVDTSSGNATLLKNNFLPPPDYPNRTFRSMAVCGDTVIAFYTGRSSSTHTLVRLDLNTLAVDSSLVIASPEKHIVSITGQGPLLYLLWLSNGREQVSVVNPRTGQTLQTFSDGVLGFPYPYSICSDGSNLLAPVNSWFDNRIVRFDASSLTVLEQQHNPIFSPQSLTWDGKYFWTIDRESNAIVKLQLEGM